MKINGKSVMMRVNGKTIALATSCSMSTTTQITESKTKDDAKGPGGDFDFIDWSMSSENLVGSNENVTGQMLYDELLALQVAGTKVNVSMELVQNADGAVPSTDWQPDTATTKTGYAPYGGEAWIESVNLNNPVDGKSTVSINFKGAGPLGKISA